MPDLFGLTEAIAPRPPFKDIRATKPAVADEKAQIALILGRACKVVPASVRSGSIQKTRAWMAALESARKVLGRRNASRQELSAALNRLTEYGA